MQLFFIVGRGRSGTDLLKTMLNMHPQAVVAPEALFVMHLYYKYYHVQEWNEKLARSFCSDLWKEVRLAQWWNLDKAALEKALIAQSRVAGTTFADMCMAVYIVYAGNQPGKSQVVMVGDKNPTYALFVPVLKKIFPDAPVIALTRDYRDNILSFQRVEFDFQHTAALAIRWRYYIKQLRSAALQFKEDMFLLKYEDMLQQPEEQLRKVCRFLKLEYREEMLAYHKEQQQTAAWQENLARPLDPTKAYKWKRDMVARQIQLADALCGNVAKGIGYTPQSEQLPIFFRIRYFPYIVMAKIANGLEQYFFRIPLYIRAPVLNVYRYLSGSLSAKKK